MTAVAAAIVLPAPRVAARSRARCRRPAPATARGRCAAGGSTRWCSPTTHNAFAAADEPGWLFANQRHGIERQLHDGIRGFMIDIHYGVRDPARGASGPTSRGRTRHATRLRAELSPRALRTADRLAGRVGASLPTGRRSPYLCHTLCELGAEPLEDQLRLFRSFLTRNRREVVVLFVEPYVPVETLEQALDRAGLLSEAAALRATSRCRRSAS